MERPLRGARLRGERIHDHQEIITEAAGLRAARESARSVRGAITSEMYEDLNSAWLEGREYDYARIESGGVSAKRTIR